MNRYLFTFHRSCAVIERIRTTLTSKSTVTLINHLSNHIVMKIFFNSSVNKSPDEITLRHVLNSNSKMFYVWRLLFWATVLTNQVSYAKLNVIFNIHRIGSVDHQWLQHLVGLKPNTSYVRGWGGIIVTNKTN